MTPARSVAASVVALGLAGMLAAPTPAFAASGIGAFGAFGGAPRVGASGLAAPQTCDRPGHYAAQSAAELLRINRLDLGPVGKPANRQATPSGTAGAGIPSSRTGGTEAGSADSPGSAAGGGTRTGDARTLPARPTSTGNGAGGHSGRASGQGGGGTDPIVGGVGLGDTRTVLIADGPVNSAGAARILNGTVAGSRERNDLVVQKAPPVSPKANTRRTGSKKFGPVQVGPGSLSARAVWAHGMACGNAAGDTSTAAAEISRLTIAGGGSASLVRVPEKITSRTGTALRFRGGVPQSVSSATITAGRISLVDNEVRLRVLRAPELRADMTAKGQSRVDYQPAVVEVVGKNGKKTRLSTAGDHIDITLSDDMRVLESSPPRLDPIGDPPLPKVSGLPLIGNAETTPVPGAEPGSTLRIALGEVRHATKNNAVAARATAIRVTLTRNVDGATGRPAEGPSGLVADFGIGMLEAAAVAPSGKVSGRSGGLGPTPTKNGTPSKGDTTGQGNTSGQGNAAGQGDTAGQGNPDTNGTSGQGNAGSGTALRSAALPVTGPRVVSLLIAGAAMIILGATAVALTSRRRKRL
jgi:hypothetical protein